MAKSLQNVLFFIFVFVCSIIVYTRRKMLLRDASCEKHIGFSVARMTRRGERDRQGQDSKNVKICEGVLYAERRRRVGSSGIAKCSQSRTPRDSHPLSLLSYRRDAIQQIRLTLPKLPTSCSIALVSSGFFR